MKESTQSILVFCGILIVLLGGIMFLKRDMLFVPEAMTVSSSALATGTIPTSYTCDGLGVQPPMSFGNLPDNTKSVVLAMEDLDVPKGGFVHWVLYNVPLSADVEEGKIPSGSAVGLNSTGKPGYKGPCPPEGKTHRYQFSAYAMDKTFNFVNPPDLQKLKSVMQGHVLSKGMMVATYTRASSTASGAVAQ